MPNYLSTNTPSNDPTNTPVIDVRAIDPLERHPFIFQTFDQMQPGAAFVIVNDHDPMPLYYQFALKYGQQFQWEYLEEGPDIWKVRISKI